MSISHTSHDYLCSLFCFGHVLSIVSIHFLSPLVQLTLLHIWPDLALSWAPGFNITVYRAHTHEMLVKKQTIYIYHTIIYKHLKEDLWFLAKKAILDIPIKLQKSRSIKFLNILSHIPGPLVVGIQYPYHSSPLPAVSSTTASKNKRPTTRPRVGYIYDSLCGINTW